MCDVGYLCANFSLARPLCYRFRLDVRDRQTSDAHHRLMPPTENVARCNFRTKKHQNAFVAGVLPGPHWGAYSIHHTPSLVFRGPIHDRGWEGKKGKRSPTYYDPDPNRRGIKRCFCLTSVAYIEPKSRIERLRKTKIGIEVGHVTCDLDTTFKTKRSRSPGRFGWLYWQANMDIQ